ncbi:polyketide cyclase/dehydrase and lipid transport [Brevibacillus sp. SYP-B805]|uniref:SRPBCC family protein n=1 Tax=Brevibacillus sp. SYP-B805 TaxID=1578199 RepID=UPI0013EAE0E5|nr:SRPBCC family protein [Brevibacillus sp. SYP-B805]NGQ95236.1 polyketide cyclase/dehydrase and lipid transport [Brevibacillus sp. SYP-B805]
MWKFAHSVTTAAKAETIWKLYQDVHTWQQWDEGIENAELFGEFKEGTKGMLQPKGQDALEFVIAEVKPLQRFSDVTAIPGAGITITFTHELEPLENGTRVTHTVLISGANAEALGPQIGEGIAHGLPHAVAALAAMAQQMERTGRGTM